jgi:predicted ATPase
MNDSKNLTVKRLLMKNFRSISFDHLNFSNPTFLIGRNGSGKSNIVDAMAFISDSMTLPLATVFDIRSGTSAVRYRKPGASHPANIGFRVDFGQLNGNYEGGFYAFEIKALPHYGFEVVKELCVLDTSEGTSEWFERDRSMFKSSITNLNPALEPSALGLPVIGGEARFAPAVKALSSMRPYSIEASTLEEMQDPDQGSVLKKDGSNAASVLQELQRVSPKDFDSVCDRLRTIVPNIVKVSTIKHGNKLALEFIQSYEPSKNVRFEGFNMSSGTLRTLGLLLAIYQVAKPSVIALEEPEIAVHVGALGAVADSIQMAAKRMQVVVTTQSPELLDEKWITGDMLRVVEWSQGSTRIGSISDASRESIQKHLAGPGELLRSNALRSEFDLFRTEFDLFERKQ